MWYLRGVILESISLSPLKEENSGLISDNINMDLFREVVIRKHTAANIIIKIVLLTPWYSKVIKLPSVDCFKEYLIHWAILNHTNVNTRVNMLRAVPREGPTCSLAFCCKKSSLPNLLVLWLRVQDKVILFANGLVYLKISRSVYVCSETIIISHSFLNKLLLNHPTMKPSIKKVNA